MKDKAGCLHLCNEIKKKTDRLTVLVNNTGATWGDDYYDFPESGWDKLMALNVKSLFYTTVELEPLLLKGATPDEPSRVINIASMAGVQTTDVTTGEGGGLSQPGHGTFSCEYISELKSLSNLVMFANAYTRRPLKSSMHSPNQNASLQARPQKHHGKCHLPGRLPLPHDALWPR